MPTKSAIAPAHCKRFRLHKERALLVDVMIFFRDNLRFESKLRSFASGNLWREAVIGGVLDKLRLDDQVELTADSLIQRLERRQIRAVSKRQPRQLYRQSDPDFIELAIHDIGHDVHPFFECNQRDRKWSVAAEGRIGMRGDQE
jgi:hypothetical protein